MPFYSTLPLKYKILSIALIGALGFVSYLAFNYNSTQNNTVRLGKIQNINFPILDKTGLFGFYCLKLEPPCKQPYPTAKSV